MCFKGKKETGNGEKKKKSVRKKGIGEKKGIREKKKQILILYHEAK